MRRLLHGLTCAAAMAVAGPACALGGASSHNMVLGRMVAPRADAPSIAATSHARAHFVLHCAGCHGVDGAGAPDKYVPDLRRLGVFLQVPGGREFIVSVPGVMGSGLTDEQVAQVTNWLLATLAAGTAPATHVPYSVDEVARARARPIADVAAARRVLLDKARAAGITID
jgi:mono/diheme cytochrome c family protein